MFRFYYLHRIETSIKYLTKINYSPSLLSSLDYHEDFHKVHLKNKTYLNPYIIKTIQKIEEDKSLVPLLFVWKKLRHYQYLEDSNILLEFSSLLVYLLSESIKINNPINYEQKKIMVVIDTLDSMDLEDILNTLDILVEELPVFLEKYEFDSEMNWKEWGKKFAIPATLSAIVIGIKIYMSWKQNGGDVSVIKSELIVPQSSIVVDLMEES